ncbi:MAG TPA: hypothetical protein DCY13_17570 [Verrucomicrobiales bacterium]|nr:hypothetical protein [Verrucomicrobiales bacterium]
MRLICLCSFLVLVGAELRAAEKAFDFNLLKDGELPAGWRVALTGGGPPPEWGAVKDELPSAFERFSASARSETIRPVIAQNSTDKTDERFPMLIYEEEQYGDFKLTTRFKTVAGETEQMAGIAFRVQDEQNYHVVRASSMGGTFLFYSFINGQRTPPVGARVEIPSNVWHTLEIDAKGNDFTFRLNGVQVMPEVSNPNFRRGKLAYWTKSDSVSYFVDTRITFTPLEIKAQQLVKSAMEKFDRLLELGVLVAGDAPGTAKMIASGNADSIGKEGYAEERMVMDLGEMMYLQGKSDVTVTLPLRDRNGDIIAAVRVRMKRFAGQTQKNAILRAQPVVGHLQSSVLSAADLYE